LLAEIDRKRSRSSSGWLRLNASSMTRVLKASQDSSLFRKRGSRDRCAIGRLSPGWAAPAAARRARRSCAMLIRRPPSEGPRIAAAVEQHLLAGHIARMDAAQKSADGAELLRRAEASGGVLRRAFRRHLLRIAPRLLRQEGVA